MTGSAKRSFGLRPRIDDAIRGEGLVTHSVAGVNWTSAQHIQMGTFGRWMEHIPLLVRVDGQEPYEASPKLWMTRAKYPVAGTLLPVTVDRHDPSSVSVEWDEVPEIDEWITAGHPVFTDPDTVERELAHALTSHRGALGGGEQPTRRREPAPTDRPSARILAATPSGDGSEGQPSKRELLLSVLDARGQRYGARWQGRIRRGKLVAEWSDIEVRVDPRKPDRIEIVWDGVPDGLVVAAQRLHEVGDQLAARVAAGPGADFSALLDAQTKDPLDQIKQLAQLRQAGAITESEFAARKARLLDQI
jgi:hypothetical protein